LGDAGTQTLTPETIPEQRVRPKLLPPWKVILWNDDHNDMLHVVRSLVKSVPSLSTRQAFGIMLEAHTSGKALVITCPLEHAELYRDRILTFGLTATIEPA
jgi:ATP-dependent Clp protease adaptor protein ClpS